MVDNGSALDELPVSVVLRIGLLLARAWPDPVNLKPSICGLSGREGLFVHVIIAMRNDGWVTYEGFIGSSGEPVFFGTCITAKGRDWLHDQISRHPQGQGST